MHKQKRVWGIKKFKPIKFIAFDFVDDEWQLAEVYPESKVVVIKPTSISEMEEIRTFKKIRNGVE